MDVVLQIFRTDIICQRCGGTFTIKDKQGYWSSLMCRCGILIYYYVYHFDMFISREDYLKTKEQELIKKRWTIEPNERSY